MNDIGMLKAFDDENSYDVKRQRENDGFGQIIGPTSCKYLTGEFI